MKLVLTKFFLAVALVCASFFFMAKNVLATGSNSPIDERPIKLAKFLASHDSPLADYADVFVAQADKNKLDYRLIPAISGVESTFGRNYIYGTYNVYGWGGGEIRFTSWENGIQKLSEGLKQNYVDKGAKDVEAISWIYCPPGNLSWAAKIRYFMKQIDETNIDIDQTAQLNLLSLTI